MSNLPHWLVNPDPSIYMTGLPLFLDFETTTKGKGLAIYKDNRIVLACWQLGWDGEMQESWVNEWEQVELVEAVQKCDFVVAHNSKFELQWLARCGIDLSTVLVYDTQLAEYVIGGNRWQTQHLSLEGCAVRHGFDGKVSLVSKMIKAGVPTEDIPQDWLATYCRRDVALLPLLMQSQLKQASGTRLLPVIYARCLLAPVLADMETEGLKLDAEIIRITLEETERLLDEYTLELNRMTGGINLASPIQVATYLYDTLGFDEVMVRKGREWVPKRTPTGRRAAGADDILALKATTADQRKFQDLYGKYRDQYSQVTKYLRKFKACCDEADGVLLARFNQTQTKTHRLSSSGLDYSTQFQNLPRAYKRFFKAKRSKWLMGEVDGAQLEFRIASHAGRDVVALEDIRHKVDVHSKTSQVMTAAGQKTDRQGAKEHTFKPLYGGSSGTEAEQAYYRWFKERYSGIADTQQRWINTVLMTKELETEWGLKYYWPDTKMDRSGYVTNTTAICNYPVQAMATAEVIPLALIFMWHRLKRMGRNVGIVLVNTIHDSIIAEVKPSWASKFHELSKQCLIDDAKYAMRSLYGIELVCPLGCGVKIGTHWGQGEEFKYEEGDDTSGTASERLSEQHEREGLERAERDGNPLLIPDRGSAGLVPNRLH